MSNISRRSVARGVVWTAPAVVVAGTAPAMAASCEPTTTTLSSAVTWQGVQQSLENGGLSADGADTFTVLYTFTNSGPDELPAGTTFTLNLNLTIYNDDVATAVLSDSTANVTIGSGTTAVTDNGDGTETHAFTLPFTLSQAVSKNGTFTVTATVRVGAEVVPATESVKTDSPVSSTEGCVTTVRTVTLNDATQGDPYDGGAA